MKKWQVIFFSLLVMEIKLPFLWLILVSFCCSINLLRFIQTWIKDVVWEHNFSLTKRWDIFLTPFSLFFSFFMDKTISKYSFILLWWPIPFNYKEISSFTLAFIQPHNVNRGLSVDLSGIWIRTSRREYIPPLQPTSSLPCTILNSDKPEKYMLTIQYYCNHIKKWPASDGFYYWVLLYHIFHICDSMLRIKVLIALTLNIHIKRRNKLTKR